MFTNHVIVPDGKKGSVITVREKVVGNKAQHWEVVKCPSKKKAKKAVKKGKKVENKETKKEKEEKDEQ